jgi:hypothetical protein
MKKLLSIVVLGLLWCNIGFSKSMMSLNQYIVKNDNWTKDPISLVYVFKRCGAVYFYASAVTSKDAKVKKKLENTSDLALKFAYEVLMEQKNIKSTEASEIIDNALDNMILKYSQDGNDYYASTGNYTSNNYIGKDLNLCKEIIEAVYSN